MIYFSHKCRVRIKTWDACGKDGSLTWYRIWGIFNLMINDRLNCFWYICIIWSIFLYSTGQTSLIQPYCGQVVWISWFTFLFLMKQLVDEKFFFFLNTYYETSYFLVYRCHVQLWCYNYWTKNSVNWYKTENKSYLSAYIITLVLMY